MANLTVAIEEGFADMREKLKEKDQPMFAVAEVAEVKQSIQKEDKSEETEKRMSAMEMLLKQLVEMQGELK